MPITIRLYEPKDFPALHKLDQSCFPPTIAYSPMMLRYFITQPGAECLVAEDGGKKVGFMITEENPPLAHVITIDVAESHRKQGVGTALLNESEKNLIFRGVHTILIETAVNNTAGVAFWQRHGYRIEAQLKNYYPGQVHAYEMRKRLPVTGENQS